MQFDTIVVGNDIIGLLYAYLYGHIFFPVSYRPTIDNSYIQYDIGITEPFFTESLNINNKEIEIVSRLEELEKYLIFLMGLNGKIINSSFKKMFLKNNKIVFSGLYSNIEILFNKCYIINPRFSWGNFEDFDFEIQENPKKLIKDRIEFTTSVYTNVDIIEKENIAIHLLGTTIMDSGIASRPFGVVCSSALESELEDFSNSELYTRYTIAKTILEELGRSAFSDNRIKILEREVIDFNPIKIKNIKDVEFICHTIDSLLDAFRQMGNPSITGSDGTIQKFQLEKKLRQLRRQS